MINHSIEFVMIDFINDEVTNLMMEEIMKLTLHVTINVINVFSIIKNISNNYFHEQIF